MLPLRVLVSRILGFLGSSRRDEELGEEVQTHLDLLAEDYIRRGLTPGDARAEARRAFGGVDQMKEAYRDQRGLPMLDSLVQDARYGVRMLRKTPAFTIAAVVSLGLGIGANTTAFTLAYSVLARPLPFPASERLVWITNTSAGSATGASGLASRMSQYRDWQQHVQSFEAVAAWNAYFTHWGYNLTGGGEPERLTGLEVSPGLFPLLGTTPAAGRLFREDEDLPGASPVVVLSWGFWQRRFGGDPRVVGESVLLNQQPHTVVGVLPADFPLTATFLPGTAVDVYLPLVREDRAEQWGFYLAVMARLQPGASIGQAQAELSARQQVLAAERPFMKEFQPELMPLHAYATGAIRSSLLLLVGAVACVLLIGCANLANLQIARARARRSEIALRGALGAGPARLFRQMLTETVILAACGGAIGIMLTFLLLRLLISQDWFALPRLPEVQFGAAAFLFTFALCALTTLVFGSVPAIQARSLEVSEAFRARRSSARDRTASRIQRGLLVAQVALAVALLTTGVLLVRSLLNLFEVDMGFRPDHVLAMRLDPGDRHPRGPRLTQFFDDVLARVSAVPGVQSAALGYNLPLDRHAVWDVDIPGRRDSTTTGLGAFVRIVSPGYFRTMRIPVLAGRDFEQSDRADSPNVVAVNRTLARLIADAREPLGSTLLVSGRDHRIIAIVSDVRHRALDEESGPEIYLSYAQAQVFTGFDLVLRTPLEPSSITPAVREAIWDVDRNQAVGHAITMQQLVDRSLQSHSLLSWVVGTFAMVAVLLATVGVYGVVAFGVVRRTQEIGIRMALGATRVRVLYAVLSETLAYVIAGVAIGVPLALWAGNTLRRFLFGVQPHDLLTVVIVCAAVIITAALAALGPARRASRLDPLVALRIE